ncbi:MAG: alpha/beta hydrolase [Chromatiales bacterium]
MPNLLVTFLTIVVITWLLLTFALYVFQPNFIYFPTKELVATPKEIGLTYESVYLSTGDGARIHGWYVPADKPRATVLYLHGNGGNISHRLAALQAFHSLALNTLIIDYHGYGLSEGDPSEDATYQDAEAAWEHLTRTRGFAPEKIIVFGESLGGAVAGWLATRHRPAAVILASPFTSLRDLAKRYYPFAPVDFLLRFHYPTLERIAKVACPILIVHSRDDEIVPFEHGERLYKAITARKMFLERTGGHNDAFSADVNHYMPALGGFITGVLAPADDAAEVPLALP